MNSQALIDIATTLVGTGRGLRAIDASTATCDKRFESSASPKRWLRGAAQQALLLREHCDRAALRGESTVGMERN